jgi:hypothetical protein
MIYSIQCQTGSHLSAENGPIGCVDDADPTTYVLTGVVQPVTVQAVPGVEITGADIAVLLSAGLGVLAMAWGFRVLGEMLFKRG